MWRRLILLAVGLTVAGLLAVGLSTQAKAGGNGAGVVRDGGGTCRTEDNTGDVWFFSCNVQIVFQPNGAITQYLTGSVIPEDTSTVPPGVSSPLPSTAADVSGGPCFVINGDVLTTVVAGVVTPSGQVQLTCKS